MPRRTEIRGSAERAKISSSNAYAEKSGTVLDQNSCPELVRTRGYRLWVDRRVTRERVHVFVSGRVQGVWFRESTRRCAEELGLSGWVKNLPDGRVEAVFEGDPAAIDRALAFVAEGPRHARVLDVETASREAINVDNEPRFTGFSVR